jgi:hypothetical protein
MLHVDSSGFKDSAWSGQEINAVNSRNSQYYLIAGVTDVY